jgi:hypothetical protein
VAVVVEKMKDWKIWAMYAAKPVVFATAEGIYFIDI